MSKHFPVRQTSCLIWNDNNTLLQDSVFGIQVKVRICYYVLKRCICAHGTFLKCVTFKLTFSVSIYPKMILFGKEIAFNS